MLNYKETYQWTGQSLFVMRKSITELGFMEIVPAIASDRYEPGAKHSIAVLGDQKLPEIKQKEGDIVVEGWRHYYMPVSHVVEKQMALEYLEKVYCLAPCLRLLIGAENQSQKHLFNFFQFEIEWRTESMDSVFETGELFLKNVGSSLLELINNKILKANSLALQNINSLIQDNYPKISFSEASERVGKGANSTQDLTPDEDAILTKQFQTPFWIYDYPEGVRDSIYHKNDKNSFDTYDLMLPFGYGELTTGGIRCKTGQDIIEQSKKLGKSYNPAYAIWKDKAQVQTAGFGIGFERFLKFISGADTVLDFVQYHDDGPNKLIDKEFYLNKNHKEI